jgi:glycosyltransferase involved in cell wall biosynthesis
VNLPARNIIWKLTIGVVLQVEGVPHNFKCGNLNFGLEHSSAEYVVMMDADMILHHSFLRSLLPHIVNSPNIAFVQIPQSYYNLPIGDPLSDASTMGYEKVLPHRDSKGLATCIGTGALFRRSSLDVIGGFQPQSITEDTTTAYALFNQGYRSVFLSEKLQIGLTPWSLEGYIKQRCRWGKGALQQFTATWKEMLGRDSKLSFWLKTFYFWHTGYYFISLVNVITVATLLSALVFNLHLTVGSHEENRKLIIRLAMAVILHRIYWFVLWLQVPDSVLNRNRDESSFWWMTPYFVQMLLETLFSYEATFNFVPTSNIDRNVGKGDESAWWKQMRQLKHVKVHLAYTITVLSIVIWKLYIAFQYYGLESCNHTSSTVIISFFFIGTCAHMIIPVTYILWPTSFKPSERKALLEYCAEGVPVFDPQEIGPKGHWSVYCYEALSYLTLGFWVLVHWIYSNGVDTKLCNYRLESQNGAW